MSHRLTQPSRKTLVTCLLGVFSAFALAAHIGSPDTFFEGQAGPYPIRVIARSPGVIPGQSEVTVRIKEGTASSVDIRPVVWSAGLEGAPPAEMAQPVRGDGDLFNLSVWLMTSSSYSLYIEVEGDRGSGTAVVPIQAIATERLEMHAGLGWLLAALGGLLFAGAVTAVGAAVREGVVAPGVMPDPSRHRAARVAMVGTILVLALALYGGKLWWDVSDESHEQRMFKSFEIATSSRVEPTGHRTLRLEIQDDEWRQRNWTPMVPDHGKLMHMFVMRLPADDAFAHIHPVRLDEDTFEVDVSELPAGQYQVYADVTHGSGFTQTLADIVELPESDRPDSPRNDTVSPDLDDSWMIGAPLPTDTYTFEDGFSIRWQRPPGITATAELDLHFTLTDPDGKPAPLEAYMGMASHAAVRKTDGEVFVHLHPTGTISMVAAELFRNESFQRREDVPVVERSSNPARPEIDHSQHSEAAVVHGTVTFPYAFPRDGDYRVWVQVKSGGKVYTAAFAVAVAETPAST